MKHVTIFISAAALAIASFAADASPVSAGGVTWDSYGTGGVGGTIDFQQWYSPDSFSGTNIIDNNTAVSIASAIDGNGYLTGLGVITELFNNRDFIDITVPFPFIGSEYCTTGYDCALTFAFGGLKVQSAIPGFGFIFDTSDAWLNIYFHQPVNLANDTFDELLNTRFEEIQDATLWASLRFNSAILKSASLDLAAGVFEGLLSVVDGGDTEVKNILDRNSGTPDLFLQGSSFIGSDGYSEFGNGQFRSIPEPTSIALLGLGLLGLVGGRRFRKS